MLEIDMGDSRSVTFRIFLILDPFQKEILDWDLLNLTRDYKYMFLTSMNDMIRTVMTSMF